LSDAGEIRARGWTQGSLLRLSPDRAAELELDPEVAYCVVSHPCDVVSPSFDRDPFVELIPTEFAGAADGNLTFGKNSRRLHLPHDGSIFQLTADAKFKIDRSALIGLNPMGALDEAERRLLASWLSSRYARPTFADEFNLRMESATKNIAKIMKAAGAHMSGIYVGTTLGELDAGTPYSVTVIVTMLTDDFEDSGSFATVSQACDQIDVAIRQSKGIDLLSLELVSEDDMSLDSLRRFARWDYDDLSFRAGDEATLPAPH
jgi:hypothetical protein